MGALVEGRSGPSSGCSVKTPAVALCATWRTRAVNTEYGSYRVTADRYTGHQDDGGEHLNSTIFSHAVYKMMTDPATAEVTSDAWATVMYHRYTGWGCPPTSPTAGQPSWTPPPSTGSLRLN